jgi:cellulose biosynthesis protein BcsQ
MHEARKAVVYAIFNFKGGSGKSTTTEQGALWLSLKHGYKTLTIDTDPQKNLEKFFDRRIEVSSLQNEVVCVSRAGDLSSTIKSMKSDYDRILIDLGQGDGKAARSACLAADAVIVPIKVSQKDLESLMGPTKDILNLVRGIRPELPVLVVPSMISTSSKTELRDLRGLWSQFETEYVLMDEFISERKVFRDCASRGASVLEAKDVKAASEVEALWSHVEGIIKSQSIGGYK